jgi:ATP-dependent Clp protease protease subunit
MPGMIPTIIERWNQGAAVGYDIYSRLLRDRIIFIGGYGGAIDTDSANAIIAQLLYLEAEDPEREINLYINSPGGMVTAGLAVYDTMQYIRAPITTICLGMAMSFGALLLAAGKKGKRYALPNARMMIHQPLIYGEGVSGQVTDIAIEAKELENTKIRLTEILSKHTGQPFDKVRADCERNFICPRRKRRNTGWLTKCLSLGNKGS